MTCWCDTLIYYAGGALLAYKVGTLLFSLFSLVYGYFLRPGKNLTQYGAWAVVTGATDGIGRAYAVELAKKKLNLVLISRTQSKLDETAKQITSRFNVQIKTIAADFATYSDDVYTNIAAALKGIEIGVLVNNVGISYDYPQFLAELNDKAVDDLIQLNIVSVTKLTKLVLPDMVARKKGAIINVSSGSGTMACPLLTVYAASKAYVDNFSRSLQAEYAAKGIFVQSLVPFFVVSKLSKMKKPNFTTPTAEAFAKQAVATIGQNPFTAGYWVHDLMHLFIRSAPVAFVTSKVMGLHLGFRKRALQKAGTKAE